VCAGLQVSELDLENLRVQVLKGEAVREGCIPLRWLLSERDVLMCKLASDSAGDTDTLPLSACPDDIQSYLEQVAQCTSVRTLALGEVKAVPECSDDLQVCDASTFVLSCTASHSCYPTVSVTA
jgi:hypothetical protein